MDKQQEEETLDTEDALYKKYGRLELITLDNKSSVTGVITSMDDKHFTIHTVKGIIHLDRDKVVSTDTKR
jgi:hypothetical protein